MILKLGLGSPTNNSPMVGDAPGYGFHPLPGPSMTMPVSESAVPNNDKLGMKSFACTPGTLGRYFDVIFLALLCQVAAELF